jgi:hypothetical protein
VQNTNTKRKGGKQEKMEGEWDRRQVKFMISNEDVRGMDQLDGLAARRKIKNGGDGDSDWIADGEDEHGNLLGERRSGVDGTTNRRNLSPEGEADLEKELLARVKDSGCFGEMKRKRIGESDRSCNRSIPAIPTI